MEAQPVAIIVGMRIEACEGRYLEETGTVTELLGGHWVLIQLGGHRRKSSHVGLQPCAVRGGLMFLASIVRTAPQPVGFVMRLDESSPAIVCRWSHDNGTWEPMYGVLETKECVALPPCFRLGEETIYALNTALEAELDG